MSVELERITVITSQMIDKFEQEFLAEPASHTLANAVIKNGIQAVANRPIATVPMQHTFSHEIKTLPVTNQKNSGRCWMFAGLNVLREEVAKAHNLESFELSQTYPMFWDKFEKANYFLESILETLSEPTDGRLISWLLSSPVQDGGQWDMFVNLVEKYGVVPKWVMPETFHSSKSREMNDLLTAKLREDAARLRQAAKTRGASPLELREEKEHMLSEVYRMLRHFLGNPPRTFDFEYRDKDNQFHRELGLTPQSFYKTHVQLNLRDYVSIINAPTADKPFGKTYTVKFLGNVKDGQDVLYLNVPMDTFKKLALAQLKDAQPVWFGCDVGKMGDRESGLLDPALFDYDAALGVTFAMTKAERLDYGESLMTHAMVLTGVNVVDERANRWKVENSWGEDPGKKGYFVMSDAWFDAYMYQIVIHRKYLSEDLKTALETPPLALAPWDPMGSLACRN
ncbi:aminopeptidase [Alicyclobacillaceae bacterium I2511]|nr:aminopeptidase [Alicyclobacillaceae bacterium I2511]